MTADRCPSRRRTVASLAIVAVLAGVLVAALTGLPGDRSRLPAIAQHAADDAVRTWHNPEVVSAIVYGWRATDTFGETFLLFAAVVSVLVVTRARERRTAYLQEERMARQERRQAPSRPKRDGDPASQRAERGEAPAPAEREARHFGSHEPLHDPQLSVVARGGALVAMPLLVVAGIVLAAQGFTPGGGFPAGAVLSGVGLLAYAAFGYRRVRPVLRPLTLEVGEALGAFAVIGLGVGALVVSGHLFARWFALGGTGTLFGGGPMQALSLAELVEVFTGLTIVVFSMLAMESEWNDEDG